MDPDLLIPMALLMGLAAALYSSVGHGGASAYLGIMALFGVAAATMRPTALTLNLLVAGFATVRYVRAGQFNARLFLAFAVTAIPAAFLGGKIVLPAEIYRPLLGAVLWFAAFRLFVRPRAALDIEPRAPSLAITLPAGAALGFLAGLTGTGGGIFLSPLILLFGWERPRVTSGVAAAFIFANSAAGLTGNAASLEALPAELPILLGAVAAGALAGTWLGVSRLPRRALLRVLAAVLAIAGAKLFFS